MGKVARSKRYFWGGAYREKDHFKNSRFPALKREISKFRLEFLLNSLEGGGGRQTARYATINDDTHFMTIFVVSMIRYNFVESSMSKEQLLSVLEFSFSEKK